MKKAIIPAGCAVAGIITGFVGGYFFARSKYKKQIAKCDEELYAIKKKEAAMREEVEGTKPTEEEAKKIAENFPQELWTESFKKNQEKRKDYKNLVRQEGYLPDDDGEIPEKKDVFDNESFERKNYKEAKSKFEEDLKLHSEYSGISEDELRHCEVSIISEEEYYEETHDTEPIEMEWDPTCSVLRDVEGNILEPEISLGDDWDMILRRVEDTPDRDTWVYDERLELYYCICLQTPRNLK